MAPGQKAYPRGTVKKIVKAHSNCNLSKNVDVMVYLDYVLFMQTLVKEAAIESKKAGERGITARRYFDQVQGLNCQPTDRKPLDPTLCQITLLLTEKALLTYLPAQFCQSLLANERVAVQQAQYHILGKYWLTELWTPTIMILLRMMEGPGSAG
ncbi:hypothetical protein CkaCkLH20_08075 [Colletotrichum karsti]|uniref:Transcription factor CBF/NF-Y/archaeal histone domain-containing protein n=1 Tax=Colletotrichum karsti TaxID=1095194 RepID=A0A9P6I035_9PEZI|nr:uncharacterized protein CkaCkLH20_08075 [Colletotrichum karsti]KAF9874512.1 hypothetical protein CkaCkLH20_08075 [Colletotrichum karsti]